MAQVKNGSLTADAYYQVRAEILACRIPPGQKLVISDLCEQFGCSLGAMREALSRLTSEDLVEVEPHKGFRVSPITEDELQDITKARATIECLCLESAIKHGDLKWEANIVSTLFELSKLKVRHPDDPERISEEWVETHQRFHEALVAACDSPWMLRLRAILYTQSERYRRMSIPLDPSVRDLNAEHSEIAEAAVARDPKRAIAALRKHLRKTTQILIKADVVKTHAI
ncbi:GntR family transcriptional regulator [Martelella soudanensis]|uniref:GntR family transcriptional regulator n=1 Tax=unclassified Martelella TaxID=2629616 RepID=UPI0015DDF50A|nr:MULTISPECIES: FCD domain-containing protein [unclassified Martelella]